MARTRGSRAPLPELEALDPPPAAESKYLTSSELAAYLRYGGKTPQCSANQFTKRHGLRRYWRSQTVALVLRADVDAVLEGRARRRSGRA